MHYESQSYEDPDEGVPAIIADAVLTLQRVAQSLLRDPQAIDDLVELSERSGGVPHFASLAETATRHNKPWRPDLLLALIRLALERWDAGGADALSGATLVDLGQFAAPTSAVDVSDSSLQLLLEASVALAVVHLEYESTRDLNTDAVTDCFVTLANDLHATDLPVALACAITATNFSTGAAGLAATDCLIATATGFDEDWARYGLAARARTLAAVQQATGQATRVDVFDAVETACRFAPRPGQLREPTAALLAALIKSTDYLGPLAPLWVLAFQDATNDPDLTRSRPYASLLWHLDWDAVIASLTSLATLASTIETERLGLLPPTAADAARADWNSWSIDHVAYRRAIPFGRSILREASLSEILLTLQHEITHVDSAYSELGQHLLALRVANLNREAQLWEYANPHIDMNDLFATGPAPLRSGNVYALGLAEQALELARKAQLLRAIWLPWLEGVAVYGELAADPTQEEEATFRPGEVLAGLIDDTASQRARQQGISLEEASRILITEADERYCAALKDVGRQRLRTYLDSHPDRYLPGYLTVRAVVASWRRKRPLTGVRAATILLSATQGGTQGVVPDLDLPPDQFERRAHELLIEWIDAISHLDEASLEALDGHPATWTRTANRELRATRRPGDDSLEPLDQQRTSDLADEASHWRTDRVTEFADDFSCLDLVNRVTAEHAAKTSGAGNMTEVLTYAIGPQQALLPIGEVTAPFWISVDTSHLICAVRVTETTYETGAPGYTCYVTPLEEDELAAMVIAVENLRQSRLRIGRFADMVPYHPEARPNRGVGRNFIGFRYGDVTLVRQAGPFTGKEAPPELTFEVGQRMAPHAMVGFEHRLADGHDAAARTVTWLEDQRAWTQDTGEPIPGEQWRQSVLELARTVAADDDAILVREAGERMLSKLGWPTGLYDDVCIQGLRGLAPDEHLDLTTLLQVMMETGSAPSRADLSVISSTVTDLLFANEDGIVDLKPWNPKT